MVSKNTIILLASLLILAFTPIRAGALSNDEVARFVDSARALLGNETFTEHLMFAWQDLNGERSYPGSLMPSELAGLMGGGEGESFFRSTVRQHGFDTFADWGRAGDLSLLALMSLDMAGHEQALQAQLEQMSQQLEGELPISESQRRSMTAMIQHTRQVLERVALVPEAHRNAVRPHAVRLRETLDYYGNN